jgi:large subunit ribosomal protein L9
MKLILKEDVENLGEIGAIVDVANGYGRNFLLPRNLAVEANPRNIKEFEHQKKSIMAKVKKLRATAEDIAEKISAVAISLEAKAGEEDKLFGSVTSKDIAEAISQKGVEVDKRKIVLDEPIKRLGEYEVTVKVQQDVTATVKVEVKKAVVEAEEA